MIDIHSHIIPNVDDGSTSIEDTFKMLKEAKNVGFDAVISTSHYIEAYYESSVDERRIWINGLQQGLDKENLELKLYLGNEVYFSENIIKLLKNGNIATLNNSKYLLFEFPLNIKPLNIYDVVFDMIGNKLIPILAHPERYTFVQENPNLIYELIEAGVLMQSNYGSIIGRYGEKAKETVKKLLKNNMIHFLGSDVHRPETIYPTIPNALDEIKAIVGLDKLEELTTINPTKIIENKTIEIEEPKEITLSIREKMKKRFK